MLQSAHACLYPSMHDGYIRHGSLSMLSRMSWMFHSRRAWACLNQYLVQNWVTAGYLASCDDCAA